ncbi:L,D-transpeptidase [Allorhizobium sp. BGMRC 0089]|uniref:L,D-transpeptidase n=1 Tax=Allorhizobium sonneratiae TaxID=2934936 RepID=UPI002033E06A|nr:L,D-transpeptidase [Allorhizobium sonneratiae]MCM2294106.1 L,D-transpeptidase [Allorhizobium sonneratiae]
MLPFRYFAPTFMALLTLSAPAIANDRYSARPPVIVSPDLTAPWLLQLGAQPRPSQVEPQQVYPPAPRAIGRPVGVRVQGAPQQEAPLPGEPQWVHQAAITPVRQPVKPLDPKFLPQVVRYETREKPGTLVIDTENRFLYLVMANGMARRYGVGVGKPGFEWAGEHHVTRKAEWPEWIPPKEMITREAAQGHYLPARMEGGPGNPLGARALYLGSTLYRIHGTNAPWTIGYGVSSGCIRMRNQDVIDLYNRVPVGTKVVVM